MRAQGSDCIGGGGGLNCHASARQWFAADNRANCAAEDGGTDRISRSCLFEG